MTRYWLGVASKDHAQAALWLCGVTRGAVSGDV